MLAELAARLSNVTLSFHLALRPPTASVNADCPDVVPNETNSL